MIWLGWLGPFALLWACLRMTCASQILIGPSVATLPQDDNVLAIIK